MKIKRKIDGKEFEFELTDDELWHAYDELQHKFDLDAVDTQFCFYTDEELMNTYQKTREEIRKLYPDIAYEMRRLMDKYDVDMEYARDEAIDYVLLRGGVVCV